MKKVYAIILVGLILALGGCSSAETMSYIEPAKLSEQEVDIVNLVMNNGKDYIFDFTADKNVQSVRFQIDELQNGKWVKKVSNGGLGFMEVGKENKGRIFLNFEGLVEGGSVFVIDEGSRIKLEIEKDENADTDMQKGYRVLLLDKKDIEYEKEIPLFIEFWDQNAVSMPVADPFENPQAFADTDCDHIYMMTVIFSQDPIDEE